MQSLTTLSDPNVFPDGKSAQACPRKTFDQSNQHEANSAGSRGAGAIAVFMAALFLAGLFQGGYFSKVGSLLSRSLEAYFLNAGIILKKIHIKGQESLGDEQIIQVLGVRSGQSLFGFDAIKAQKRLSQLGQVKSARVMRLLPSTLLVEIVERQPFARWLHEGRVNLIDRQGVVLNLRPSAQDMGYPLVVGAGAGEQAEKLIRILSTHTGLAGRLKMAERVGQYRWNLHANSGAVIKLPPQNLALALARLVELPDWNALLANKKLVIDLRHPGQAFVRQLAAVLAPSVSSL